MLPILLLDDVTPAGILVTAIGCLLWLACVVVIIGLPVFIIMHIRKRNREKNQPKPLISPMNTDKGVFFGLQAGQPIVKPFHLDGHVFVVGGAGTGKSACIAIPTLLYHWQGRFFAVDIKGELAEKSQRKAAIFNPLQPDSYGYDPFYALKESKNINADIQSIALTLVPDKPHTNDPFWTETARNLLAGHLLFSYKDGASFIETMEVLQSMPPKKIIEIASEDPEASMLLGQLAEMKLETLTSIKAELSRHIMLFATDPDIKQALSKPNIITPHMLETGENIFLQLPEYKLDQWRSLLSLIIQQFLQHFERRPEQQAVPTLFLLDEYPRLGKIEATVTGLTTLRSKRITACIIAQSLAQLDSIYGHDQRKIIVDNCSYKAILGATDADTQEYFSKLVGTEEREKSSYNRQSGYTYSKEEKRIIRPEQFAYLGNSIVVISPFGYLQVEKAPYYTSFPVVPQVQPQLQQPRRN